MGRSLLKGKCITNISFPIQVFKDESNHLLIAKNLSFAPLIFDKPLTTADMCVDRMKKTLIFSILMTISGISVKKPFNPILGETYQGSADGCPIFIEQISHHPPQSAFYFKGRGYTI